MADTALLAPIGVRGLRQWGGDIDETVIPALKGRRRFRTYKHMSTEPLIAASLLGTELIMRKVPMTVTPAIPDDSVAQEMATWLHGALFEDMEQSWQETLSEILTMRVFGWAVCEILYKQRRGARREDQQSSKFTDGKYGWAGFDIRAQETLLRWQFDDQQRLTGMQQQPETGGIFTLPAEKMLLFRVGQHKGNPEGVSLLNNVHKPWYDKQEIRKFQNIGIERDLAGYPVLYVPGEILTSVDPAIVAIRTSYQNLIMNIRRNENEGAMLPSNVDANSNELYKLKLLSAEGGAGGRQFDIPAIVQQLNVEILIALFTDLLMLGHDKSGSWALSSDKTSMLGYALSAMLDSICGVINRYAIPRLWRLNGFAPELQPVLGHGDIESVNLQELGQFIAQMSTAGLDVLGHEAEVWQRAGFTAVEEEEAV